MHAHDRERALDGLRGIAIALVVAYHAAPGVARGGFVGVSVFFTLSGYLIGTRLIDEWSGTGRVDLVRFWSKRARRLLPAALVTILVTVIVAYARGDFDRTLGRAGLAAATYQQNWYQLSRSGGYGALFDRASPLDHFWSLAIEEQFYIVFPVVLIGLLAVFRGSRRGVGIALVVAALATFLVPTLLGLSFERRYLGTDARIGEIVVGVVLALAGSALLARARWAVGLAAPALLALLAIAFAVPYGSGFFAAGFLPITVLTCCALAGAVREGSVAHRVLSVRPLAYLGALSYSLYLVHWPLLTLTDDGTAATRIVAVVGAVAISAALHYAVERPGMRVLPIGGRTLAAGLLATAMVATALVVAAPGAERDVLAEIQAVADEIGTDGPNAVVSRSAGLVPIGVPERTTNTDTAAPTAPPRASPDTVADSSRASVSPSTTVPVPPPRLGFVGDSVALTLGLAAEHDQDAELYRPAPWAVEIGCGMARFSAGSGPTCDDPVERIAALPPDSIDVAVVISCQWELIARKLPGEDHKRDISDPVFQDHVYAEYLRVAHALVAVGVDTILWGVCAPMSEEVLPRNYPAAFRASRDADRQRALADVVARVAANDPAVDVVDLGQLVSGRIDDPVLRPDGNHFEFEADVGIAAEFNELIRCLLPPGCPAPTASTARL
jgi:peptidoglycan/LPS O-acetylase OafA/YrhL